MHQNTRPSQEPEYMRHNARLSKEPEYMHQNDMRQNARPSDDKRKYVRQKARQTESETNCSGGDGRGWERKKGKGQVLDA